jgi:hypothetical protein
LTQSSLIKNKGGFTWLSHSLSGGTPKIGQSIMVFDLKKTKTLEKNTISVNFENDTFENI